MATKLTQVLEHFKNWVDHDYACYLIAVVLGLDNYDENLPYERFQENKGAYEIYEPYLTSLLDIIHHLVMLGILESNASIQYRLSDLTLGRLLKLTDSTKETEHKYESEDKP